MSTTTRGRRAEDRAVTLLEAEGYRIVARNHRARTGEVDVIAWDGEVLCFVEVRSLAHERRGWPEETVGRQKQRRIVRAALDWLVRNDLLDRCDVRFDVLALTGDTDVRLVRDAFEAGR